MSRSSSPVYLPLHFQYCSLWYTELQFFPAFIAHEENLQEFMHFYMCTSHIKKNVTSTFDAVMIIMFLIRNFVMHNSSNHCWTVFDLQYLKQQGREYGFIKQDL